jgi:hypothetical protein
VVPASQVTYVQDDRTCRRALDAFNTVQHTPARLRRLQVYGFGKHVVIEDPDVEGAGEYRALHIFDERWRYQSTMAAF